MYLRKVPCSRSLLIPKCVNMCQWWKRTTLFPQYGKSSDISERNWIGFDFLYSVNRSNLQRKSARLVVVTKEDISMYSGSRRRFTDMSPAFSRHKSEMIPTSKNRIVYRSKKFMLLTRQDEEILAEPLLLEKTLSLIPDSEHESRLDPSLE